MLVENQNHNQTTNSLSRSRLNKMLRVEWLGQMAASLFWIVSVLTYGIKEPGDWLQMLAACSWLVVNLATVLSNDSE